MLEQVQSQSPLPVIQIPQYHLFGQLQGVDQLLLRRERGPAHKSLDAQMEQDENYVDKGCSGLIEVIIISGDELAQLIYESPKSGSTQGGSHVVGGLVQVAQTDDQGQHHEQAAQEDMGDMKAAGAQAWVPRQGQKETDAQDGGYRCDEEDLQQVMPFQAAHEMAIEKQHRPR